MRRFFVTILNHRHTSFQKVYIVFAEGEMVTLDGVQKKVIDKLNSDAFMIIAWSPVDDITFL